MKIEIWDLTIIAFVLSILAIVISGHILGQDKYDFNWWIALLIYSIPAFILSALNGTFLIVIQRSIENKCLRIVCGMIPAIVLLVLLLTQKGMIEYIAIFGIIPISLTYMIWIRKLPTTIVLP